MSMDVDESVDIRRMIVDFSQDRVLPLAEAIDEDDALPSELYRELGELGLLGMLTPEEYDGSGLSTVLFSEVVEELAVASASVANAMCVAVELADFLSTHGSEAQKKQWVPKIVSGEAVAGFALTEPDAGSDLAQISLRATAAEGGYRLNGVKSFITNAVTGDIFLVIARTGGEGKDGMTAFLVDGGAGGLSRGKKSQYLGVRGLGTTELIFEDCFVPAESIVGVEGQGFALAMSNLNLGRIAMGSEALGIARAALQEATRYALTREQFGRSIFKFQGVSFPLADIYTRVDASRLLLHRAAAYRDQGRDYRKEASMAKHFAAETAMRSTDEAMHILGAYGYSMESRTQRLFRDAKLTQVYEGSRNIQRMIISHQLQTDIQEGRA